MLLCDEALLEEEERELNRILRYLRKIADREKCSINVGINYVNPEDPFSVVTLSNMYFPDIDGKGYWMKLLKKEGKYETL